MVDLIVHKDRQLTLNSQGDLDPHIIYDNFVMEDRSKIVGISIDISIKAINMIIGDQCYIMTDGDDSPFLGDQTAVPNQVAYCDSGYEGYAGPNGVNGGRGGHVFIRGNLHHLGSLRIDTSGGSASRGGDGGQGGQGGGGKCFPPCKGGGGGAGGPGGIGGTGGDAGQISFFWNPVGPLRSQINKSQDTADWDTALRNILAMFDHYPLPSGGYLINAFPPGLTTISRGGLGRRGGYGGPGGGPGAGAVCAGIGLGSNDPGDPGKHGADGKNGKDTTPISFMFV